MSDLNKFQFTLILYFEYIWNLDLKIIINFILHLSNFRLKIDRYCQESLSPNSRAASNAELISQTLNITIRESQTSNSVKRVDTA